MVSDINNDDESSDSANNSNDDDDDYNEEEDDDESYCDSEEEDLTNRTLLFLCEEGQLDVALQRVREWDEQCPIIETSKTATSTTTTNKKPIAARKTQPVVGKVVDEATIQQEIYRKNNATGNYLLHEILAGGTSGKSAPELVQRLLRRYNCSSSSSSSSSYAMFLAQPLAGSRGRTILHWCAWCKTSPTILRLVLNACPEAMCRRDNGSYAVRTPLKIAQRYWPDDEISTILQCAFKRYLPHRIRLCVCLCVRRLFLCSRDDDDNGGGGGGGGGGGDEVNAATTSTNPTKGKTPKVTTTSSKCQSLNSKNKTKTTQTPMKSKDETTTSHSTTKTVISYYKPFDKTDRKITGLKPRPWFVASVFGYFLQREMNGLIRLLLSFVGHGAKLEMSNESKKRMKAKKKRTKASSSTGTTVKRARA